MTEDIKTLMKLFVEIGNEYKNEILSLFDEDVTKYTLALLIADANEKYGFYLSQGKLKYVEGSEANYLLNNATVTAITTSDFIIKIINSENWEKTCRFGYNVGLISYQTRDRRYIKHGKNLLKLINYINKIAGE